MHPIRFFALSAASLAALTAATTFAAAPAPVEVAVTSPKQGDIHRFVSLPGTLRANQQVTLHAKVAGYLKSISVDRGDTVKAGQLIAEIEMPSRYSSSTRCAPRHTSIWLQTVAKQQPAGSRTQSIRQRSPSRAA